MPQSYATDSDKSIVKPLLNKGADLRFGQKLEFPRFENPVQNILFGLASCQAGGLEPLCERRTKQLGFFCTQYLDEFVAEQPVNLLFFAGRLDDIGNALKQVAVFVEGFHDEKLTEQTDVLDKHAEQQQRKSVVFVAGVGTRVQLFAQHPQTFGDGGNLVQGGELIL